MAGFSEVGGGPWVWSCQYTPTIDFPRARHLIGCTAVFFGKCLHPTVSVHLNTIQLFLKEQFGVCLLELDIARIVSWSLTFTKKSDGPPLIIIVKEGLCRLSSMQT